MHTDVSILYDWLSFSTSHFGSPDRMIDFLGFQDLHFQEISGMYGYAYRYYYDGVSIHYGNPDKPDTVWVELSGKGCRVFESFGLNDWDLLLAFILDKEKKCSLNRLDIAIDDRSGLLDIQQICEYTDNEWFVSPFKTCCTTRTRKADRLCCSATFGSQKSDIFIRIYDKSAEQGLHQNDHWIRVELQLRDDRCSGFSEIDLPIGEKVSGVLNNYLRFVTPKGKDTNKRRWLVAQFWEDFIASTQKCTIWSKPGSEFSLDKLQNYVFYQAGGAINALIDCYGREIFCDNIEAVARQRDQNPKYQRIVEEFRAYDQK